MKKLKNKEVFLKWLNSRKDFYKGIMTDDFCEGYNRAICELINLLEES